jgi:hypothetical protein
MSRSQYEVVKVLAGKIFIIDLCLKGHPSVIDELELVFQEINKHFPDKRIILSLDDDGCDWVEIFETTEQDDFSPTGYEVMFGQYLGKIPKFQITKAPSSEIIRN